MRSGGKERSTGSDDAAVDSEIADRRAALKRIASGLGGLWNLANIATHADIVIPSVESRVGKLGKLIALALANDYFPPTLQTYVSSNHDLDTLDQLGELMHVHIRSRLAQLGLDGELHKFLWVGNKLRIVVRLFSHSSRDVLVQDGDAFLTTFTTEGSTPVNLRTVTADGWLAEDGTLLATVEGGQRGVDFGIIPAYGFAYLSGTPVDTSMANVTFAYARLKPDWQVVTPATPPIIIPQNGEGHSDTFRSEIDAQLSDFTHGESCLIIGETVPYLEFAGPAILRPEIIGIHKETGEVMLLEQTNSPIMGETRWPIRVEVRRADGKPISAEELRDYDLYMFLQFYEQNSNQIPQPVANV